jgi:hypothetical protein
MEEAPENSKELSHSAHGNGMNVVYQLYLLLLPPLGVCF